MDHPGDFTPEQRPLPELSLPSAGRDGVIGVDRRRLSASVAGAAVLALLAAGCYAPRGVLDNVSVSVTPTGVWVSGWVDDRDAPGASTVIVSADGVTRAVQAADLDRPDVAAAMPGAKVRSGFNVFVPLTPGAHTVCASAANTGGNETDQLLGCRSVVVNLPTTTTTAPTSTTAPTTTTTLSPQPSGRGSATSYSFMAPLHNGVPVRWDGCQPVHFTTNTVNAYPEAHADIVTALAQISEWTGLSFVDDGAVSTVPSVEYGQPVNGNFPPLLIGWTTAAQSNLFNGTSPSVVGVAGSAYYPGRYVSGRVALERDRLASAPRTGPYSKMTVLLHEIGHAIGLGHFADTQQIMNPYMVPYGDLGAGDKAGLIRLGTPGCTSVLRQSPESTDELRFTPLMD